MRKIRALVGVMLLSVCLPACGDDLMDETEAAEQEWENARPSRYEIVVQNRCECDITPIHTTVAGEQKTALRVGTGEQAAPLGVEELFRKMLGYLRHDYAEAEAEFDSEWHYPTSFYVDPDKHWADEEWGFEVKCFAAGEAHCEK